MAKMPKRNKSLDNPYTLGFDDKKQVYTVEFIDNKKIIHKVAITVEVYNAFDKFELDDISQIHKFRKHIEHFELTENTLYSRMIKSDLSIEDIVEKTELSENLRLALNSLTKIQKRRIKMYYFDDLTLQEIAKIEGCSVKNVHKSIEQSKAKLKELLKNKI